MTSSFGQMSKQIVYSFRRQKICNDTSVFK